MIPKIFSFTHSKAEKLHEMMRDRKLSGYVFAFLVFSLLLPWIPAVDSFAQPESSMTRGPRGTVAPTKSCLEAQRGDDLFSTIATSIHRGCAVASLSTIVLLGSWGGLPLDTLASDQFPAGQRYWSIMSKESSASQQERIAANEALLDYLVGTINTQFYDNTGGAFFAPRDFYSQWKVFKRVAEGEDVGTIKSGTIPKDIRLDTREGAVQGLKWLVGTINDPFSKYLTREELQEELQADSTGFLGTGAVVEAPHIYGAHQFNSFFGPQQPVAFKPTKTIASLPRKMDRSQRKVLTITRAANLPVVTAVAPDSPAERAGLVVGDRVVAIGDNSFLGWTRQQVEKQLSTKYNQKSYFGQAELTVAKPIFAIPSGVDDSILSPVTMTPVDSGSYSLGSPRTYPSQEVVLGYRQTRVRLPLSDSSESLSRSHDSSQVAGGDFLVHYELLRSQSGGIFDHLHSDALGQDNYKVGYIRLTRFSKASTAGYVNAVEALQDAGAQSFILDLRNNYGGVIQEAMLVASTVLRDPHAVLCYTMNARGGFTPHDAEEYIVDRRYPGYLLSSEPRSSTIDQVQKENPAMFVDNGIAWDPPSSYASLHEQVTKRGIRRIGYMDGREALYGRNPGLKAQFKAQKKIVLLINEGTASAAEVFVAALHDNARTTAVIGTKSYGKGLIQHTFPMPDGGGLRLTTAEYLTPALAHVTKVGGARYDPTTGEFIGGGVRPDIFCESKQGIPRNIRADLCVGMALDALEEASEAEDEYEKPGSTTPSSGLIASTIPSQVLWKPLSSK